jgi:hypothetical protein
MDQADNLGGGPILGAAPNPIPNLPPADTMAQLVQAMGTLANVSTMQLANNLSKVKAVQKPTPFKGDQGSDAHRFLAAFTMWAMAQGTALNVVDQQGNAVDRRDLEWIHAALSYLQGEAAIWASPAMEEFANGGVPFHSQWETFCDQFKVRFKTVDEAVDAKEKLRTLWQDTSSVPEYTAPFKQLMARVTPLILSRLHALRLCFLLTLFVRPDRLYRLPDSLQTLPLSRYLAALVSTRLTMLTFLFRIHFSRSCCLCLLTLPSRYIYT